MPVIANVFIPYFAGQTMAGFLLLIPVIIIEALLLKPLLKVKWLESLKFCAVANLVSTMFGLVLIVCEAVSYVVAGVLPILGILFLALFPASFVLSIWIEYKVYKKFWKIFQERKLLKPVIIVNIVTYIPLLILTIYINEKRYDIRMERPRRINCQSNLKQIYLALEMYAMDNKNFLPDKPGGKGFKQLYDNDYLTEIDVYRCPSSRSFKNNSKVNKLSDKNISYIYRSGHKLEEKSGRKYVPIVWDKPENHKDYGNVLYLNGKIKSFKGADWMRQANLPDTIKQYE